MMQLVNNFSSYTEETPIDKTPNDKTPNDKTPNDKTPNDKTPNDKTPNDKTPIEKMPIDFLCNTKNVLEILYKFIFGFVNPIKAVFRKSPS